MRISTTIDDFIYGLLKEQAMKRNIPVNNIIRRAIYKELHDLANQNRAEQFLKEPRIVTKPVRSEIYKIKARHINAQSSKSPAQILQEDLNSLTARLAKQELTLEKDAKGKLTIGFKDDKPTK